MKRLYIVSLSSFIFFLILTLGSFAQSYQGPAQGSLSSGITQNTNSFEKIAAGNPKPFVHNVPEYNEPPMYIDFGKLSPAEGSNYINDNTKLDKTLVGGSGFLVQNFNGIPMTNSIPPDCNVAVGPTHVLGTVNTRFNIWDKNGNLEKSINGDTWVAALGLNQTVVCDPKIIYDHYDKRWVMVWLTTNDATHTSYWTISVSDDSIPLGSWNTWATPSNYNGSSNANNFGDYEGLGYDKDCLYITGNQFQFGGYFQYSKVRILPKAALYASTPGAITWNDIWDIRTPGTNASTFGIRPSVIFDNNANGYLFYAPRNGGNSISVYKINDPLGTPSLTGFNVPVTYYSQAPDVNQLGGGRLLIDGGSSQPHNEGVYRDGSLWFVHSVMNPENYSKSALHYVRIDVPNQTALEDVVWGDTANWYSYPSLMVDKDKNVTVAYSRSALTEYIGAFYSSRKLNDPPGFSSGSKPLAIGKGNYVLDYGTGRNRWGDYTGIALDPSDQYNIWMLTEYSAGTNQWGTHIGQVLAGPMPGIHPLTSNEQINFGNVEVSDSSDILTLYLYNLGSDNLSIQDVPVTPGAFQLVSNLTYPVSVGAFDTLELKFRFIPPTAGNFEQTITLTSNAPSDIKFKLLGRGYTIPAAAVNTLYASTGTNQQGGIHTINRETGTATLLGTPIEPDLRSIAVNQKTKIIYGLSSDANESTIMRINPVEGAAYRYFKLPIANLVSIAFDTAGVFYAGGKDSSIYKIDLSSLTASFVCKVKAPVYTMTFNPENNQLWAASYAYYGTKDKIFKVNITTGDTTNVGRTGINANTNALSFDLSGKLFAASGSASQLNKLYAVSTTNAVATLIGSTGIKEITGLSFSGPDVAGVNDKEVVPSEFSLAQNYPNPFNPSTVIEYSIPNASNVKIVVYNILGQKITELVNTFQQAGTYKVNWNAVNNSGVKLTSGIYFYEMKASNTKGQDFSQIKKMILIK